MKFAKQLQEYELPAWRGYYIPYRALKKQLEHFTSSDHIDDELVTKWRQELRKEALRAGDFVDRGMAGLEAQLHDLTQTAEGLRSNPARDFEAADESEGNEGEGSFDELRVLEAVGRLDEGVQRLRGFAELNHAALYKILKKHDKLLGTRLGLGGDAGMFKELLQSTHLADTGRMDALAAELRKLSLQGSQTAGLDASMEVARLAAGLGSGGTRGIESNELVLSFFLGSSLALFVSIGVLLLLPTGSEEQFAMAYFLTPMPVFQVVFSVLLSLWCMGAVAWTCDRHDINHLFILNVDPRCRVSSNFFFSRAATLTNIWILIFGMYVVDYKWGVLPTVWAKTGYNDHSSLHFAMYPIALAVVTFLGVLWPSRVCRNRYKASIVKSMRRTATAPLHPVDFSDNMVGDVLTSIAKPLQGVPAAVCYLVSPHPQQVEYVEQFTLKGDTCSATTHHVVLPAIAGLPYVFRALQCLRRFHDTKEVRHLWNFGKYISSLLVVVVTSIIPDRWVSIAVVSAVATVYAGFWDVALDWGLDWQELGCRRAGHPVDPNMQALHEYRRLNELVASPGGSRLKPVRVERPERHFPAWVYWCCSIIDLLGRSTWVLTLMPVTLITNSVAGRVVLVSFISSVEIVRRSIWAVLRIEYEQVANASGFRALLWVPSKLNRFNKPNHGEQAGQRRKAWRSSLEPNPANGR